MRLNTKQAILEAAIFLFADFGYENVSLKQIAQKVGIQTASIYNHFAGKETLLEEIYRIFTKNQERERPKEKEYLPVLKTGTAKEIIQVLNYPLSEPVEINFAIVRIVFGRFYIDEEAKRIHNQIVVNESVAFITGVLQKGVQIGRVQMNEEEIEMLALILISIRKFTADRVVTDPNREKWRITEVETTDYVSKLLKIGPPVQE